MLSLFIFISFIKFRANRNNNFNGNKGSQIYTQGGVTVELEKGSFNKNEDIKVKVKPKGNYWLVLNFKGEQALTSQDLDESQEYSIYKMNAYSYGPAEAILEVWKINPGGNVEFYYKNVEGEYVRNRASVEVPIQLLK